VYGSGICSPDSGDADGLCSPGDAWGVAPGDLESSSFPSTVLFCAAGMRSFWPQAEQKTFCPAWLKGAVCCVLHDGQE
jgi:hypothetical protein